MLDFGGKTRIIDSKEFPLVTGSSITAEGVPMVSVLEDGVEKIKPTAGAAGEKFAGFSYGYIMKPVYKTMVEVLDVPAETPFTVTLKNTPVTGQIAITNGTTEQAAGTPATTDNQYSISGSTITFNEGRAGDTMTITYKYSPSALELLFEDKTLNTTYTPTEILGSIGCILKGEVWTDQYDASCLWTAASTVKLAPNGLLSSDTSTNGITLTPNGLLSDTSTNGITLTCTITHVPTEDNPFLGIRF